jgi:two-component system OmpR family response regulator
VHTDRVHDPRVLLVHDDAAVQELLTAALGFTGFSVRAVPTATRALAALRAEGAELLLVSSALPDMDGVDLVRVVRSGAPGLGVVMLACCDEVADRVEGLAAGADDFVGRPFDLVELAARLRAVLRRGGPVDGAGEERLRCADLLVDVERVRVERAGQRVELSPTEFRLLVLLLQHQGKVLSKPQILRLVWGHEFGDTAVVEKFVSQLRRKLGPPSLVHTVRGFGYALRTDG